MKILAIIFLGLGLLACTPKEKKAQKKDTSEMRHKLSQMPPNMMTQIANMNQKTPRVKDGVNSILAEEILRTDNYLYVRGKGSNNHEIWMATNLLPLKVGQTYFFAEGLLKTDFYSKQLEKTFDTLYLVNDLVPENHGNSLSGHTHEQGNKDIVGQPEKTGTQVTIAKLLASKEKFAGKTVQLTGMATKVNEGIMGRNWVHLIDGSKDDYDFVVTTNQTLKVNQKVTLRGVVSLKRDFGFNYQYEILVEHAEIVNEN